MDEKEIRQTVLVARDEQLRDNHYYRRMWKTAKSLTHISSRGWVHTIEFFFCKMYELKIQLRYPGGEPYPVPYIYDLFLEEIENSRKWVSDFLRADASGDNPRSMANKLERLRAIDLYLRSNVARYSDATWLPMTPKK